MPEHERPIDREEYHPIPREHGKSPGHLGLESQRMYRGLLDAELNLGFHVDDLKGKHVLEIGSGFGNLSRDLIEQGVEVTACDPYTQPVHQNVRERFIAAAAENLPVSSESQDFIISLYAVPYYYKTEDEVRNLVKELARILKPGGKAALFPLLRALNVGHDWGRLERESMRQYPMREAETFLRVAGHALHENPSYGLTMTTGKSPEYDRFESAIRNLEQIPVYFRKNLQ